MLTITVPGVEFFDEKEDVFTTVGDTKLELEHSLISLSKWESIHEKPFLADGTKSSEEVIDYIKAMILTEDYPPDTLDRMNQANIDSIVAYIDKKMTATWFPNLPGGPKSRESITNELIYFWMSHYQIPLECQEWHLNRLFTLIKVANAKNSKPKKMSPAEQKAWQVRENERRKALYKTTG